jgi:hypothetical protein
MELIEIISTILLLGGGLLVFVVITSFFISRLKKEDDANYSRRVNSSSVKQIRGSQRISFVQPTKEKNIPNPQIFQLEQIRPREIKMIRKVTFKETLENARSNKNKFEKTNGDRYKIINEEQKKSRSQVVNFF